MRHPIITIDPKTFREGLEGEISNGMVSRKHHPDGLSLYCYTKSCVFNRGWNQITEITRGLIMKDEEIIGLPFPKFFNLGERSVSLPAEKFQTYEKLDGSLIIVFNWKGEWLTATKGSFITDQAKWAKIWLSQRDTSKMSPDVTYLFEAIYPENRIVVRYNESGLVLLGAYNRLDASEYELYSDHLQEVASSLKCRVAKLYDFDHVDHILEEAKTLDPNNEGWVIRYPSSGLRLKVKGDEYCRIHRVVSGITPLDIWRMMLEYVSLDEFKRDVPEEFWTDFDNIRRLLEDAKSGFYENIYEQFTIHQDKDGRTLASLGLPKQMEGFIFALRKDPMAFDRKMPNGKRNLVRDRFFDLFRPTSNVLYGYVPSSAMNRVLEE